MGPHTDEADISSALWMVMRMMWTHALDLGYFAHHSVGVGYHDAGSLQSNQREEKSHTDNGSKFDLKSQL